MTHPEEPTLSEKYRAEKEQKYGDTHENYH